MFCDRCGTKTEGRAAFCPGCGRNLARIVPNQNRVEGHVRLLGILWLAYGALHLSPGLAVWAFFRRGFLPDTVPPFVFHFFPWISGLLILTGAAAVLVGIALLLRQTWARMAAIVVGALNLTSLPFGTALEIYTLWALLPARNEQEYRVLSRAA